MFFFCCPFLTLGPRPSKILCTSLILNNQTINKIDVGHFFFLCSPVLTVPGTGPRPEGLEPLFYRSVQLFQLIHWIHVFNVTLLNKGKISKLSNPVLHV